MTTSQLPRPFGRYVLLRMLDGGGQGRVDLALTGSPEHARICVIKRMLPEIVEPDARARFDHELEVTRRLSHPAVVQTLAVDEIEGEPCIIQELVEGHSLAYMLSVCGTRHMPIPVTLAIHVAHEVASGLAYVHDFEGLGLVHRDVSPANIEMGFAGEVKLLDFGVAKSIIQDFETAAGMVVGRPVFVAPEVHAGAKADRRSDIYSLGVVLWGLLTRRFIGDVRNAKGGPPPPSTFNPQISKGLDAIVARALAPRPEDRYPDAHAFQKALRSQLPHRFDGPAAVRGLLASLFDVEAERRMRGIDLEAACAMLPRAPLGGEAPADPGSRVVLRRFAAVGLLIAAALLGIAYLGARP